MIRAAFKGTSADPFNLQSRENHPLTKTLRSCAVDFGQTAAGMVRNFGNAAENEALACAAKFQKLGDDDGFDTWTTVARLIHRGTHLDAVEEQPARNFTGQSAPY